MLIAFFAYTALIIAVLAVERIRTRMNGPDLVTCFLGLFSIQTVIPATVVVGVLTFFGRDDIDIRRSFFEYVFVTLDAATAMHVLLLTALFIVSFYMTLIAVCGGISKPKPITTRSFLYVSMLSWLAVVVLGLFLSWMLLSSLGGGFGAYAKLIQFRAGDPSIARNFTTANLYSLTQTFSLLSIIGVVVFLHHRNRLGVIVAILAAVAFALMMASRRALFVQLILIYFVFVLEYRQYFVKKWLLPITTIALPIVMYGKEALASIAFDSRVDLTDMGLGSLVRAVMDIGITMAESWATLMYLHEPFRFGIDHLLSVARRIPEGILGLDIEFPQRIVRISTGRFVGWNEADLPPGFFGQMWLDWGYFGPLFWGVAFGIQLGLLQNFYDSVSNSIGMRAIFVLLLFIVTLPVNTGSFDFTFSVDIFALVFFLLLMVRGKTLSHSAGIARATERVC